MTTIRKSKADREIVYCACCGAADSRTAARLRKFFTGFSACCNENLLERRPRHPVAPKVFTGPREIGKPIK